jgi:hypothetical protein
LRIPNDPFEKSDLQEPEVRRRGAKNRPNWPQNILEKLRTPNKPFENN